MSRPPYTTLLAAGTWPSGTTATYHPGAAGDLVVITCMDLINVQSTTFLQNGFSISRHDGTIIWAVETGQVLSNQPYHWEGRQALAADREINVTTADPFWHWNITGFVLTP